MTPRDRDITRLKELLFYVDQKLSDLKDGASGYAFGESAAEAWLVEAIAHCSRAQDILADVSLVLPEDERRACADVARALRAATDQALALRGRVRERGEP